MSKTSGNWDLTKLYENVDSEKFKTDFINMKQIISDMKEFAEKKLFSNLSTEAIISEYIEKTIILNDLIDKLYNFCNLTTATNTNDSQANKMIDLIENEITALTIPTVAFQKWLCSVENISDIIKKSNTLKEHEFYLFELIEDGKHTLSESEEYVIAKMKTTGSSSFSKLQELLLSNLMVDYSIDGEDQIPISLARNLAHDENSEIRKNAYEAELKSYEKVSTSVAACLNSIKGEVMFISNAKGYESVLDMTLKNSRMTEQTLNAMLKAIENNVHIFENYFKAKSEFLGHENGLPFYDLFAPVSDITKKFTFEECKDFIIEHFTGFSSSLGEFAKNAFEKKWIDVHPKKGKVGGAFCANLHSIGESRVLVNFNGSFDDVITVAHELGHAYHGDCLKNESSINYEYPMPIAETASTFCEIMVKNAFLENCENDMKKSILEQDISDNAQVIIDIYSRFLFESSVISNRADGPLSEDELCKLMLDAQKKAYGNGLDKNFMHKYMWVCKPHYYDANFNFYNFPYAYGMMFARGIFAKYLDNKETFPNDYQNMLKITGKENLEDIAKVMNIDVTEVSFWEAALNNIEKDILKFIELLKK